MIKFIVKTFGYHQLEPMQEELNRLDEFYEVKVIEPMETFILVVWSKK